MCCLQPGSLEAEAVNYKLFSTNHRTYRIFFLQSCSLHFFNVDSDLDPALQVNVDPDQGVVN